MTGSLERAFNGRRVLVTGHTGFKGAWLALWLRRLGARVYGYALPPERQPSLYESLGGERAIEGEYGDIVDFERLRASFLSFQPEIVFHLAAQALVRVSYRQPVTTYASNVMGTVHVLEAARQTPGVRGIVVITSDKCYENREWSWPYREPDRLGGLDPYSSSKACAELVTASYRRSFLQNSSGPLVASCRAGNVIGGGDWAEDRLFPDVARSVLSGRPVVIRNPKSVRPWQHVLEPLRGYLIVAKDLLEGQVDGASAWNFGPLAGAELSVLELVRIIIREWGKGEICLSSDAAAVHEASVLRLDSTKARLGLGWTPLLDAREAVRLTVDWYRRYEQEPGSMRDLTLEQIEGYMHLCQTPLGNASSAG